MPLFRLIKMDCYVCPYLNFILLANELTTLRQQEREGVVIIIEQLHHARRDKIVRERHIVV